MGVTLVFIAWAHLIRIGEAAPSAGPLTCHKVVCAVAGPCQVRESESCVHGGGPPHCPAFLPLPDGTACDDGVACTTGDSCHAGVCGGTVDCPSSNNPCVAAICQPNSGCGFVNVANGTACEDGDLCTTGSTCQAGVCGGGSPVTCGSGTQTCDPASGSCVTECGPGGCLVAGTGVGNPTLTVPAAALNATVPITMVDLGGDPGDPSVFHVYQFGPDGTQFATPATVDLPAPPLAPGQVAVIEVTQGTGWVAIPTALSNNRVSGPIAHFSGCRTRAAAPPLSALSVDDMVQFQDRPELEPVGLWPAACDPPDPYGFGICVTVTNKTASPITTTQQATIFGWQCYSRILFTYVDPVTNEFEGTHCNPAGFLLPCGSVQVDVPMPPGGLAPNQSTVVRYSFPADAPLSCFNGSADVGIDFAFAEPTSPTDHAGMRSAKVGPFVNGSLYNGPYPALKQGLTRQVKNFLIQAQF